MGQRSEDSIKATGKHQQAFPVLWDNPLGDATVSSLHNIQRDLTPSAGSLPEFSSVDEKT